MNVRMTWRMAPLTAAFCFQLFSVCSDARADAVGAADPNLDRGVVLPTALTQPAGTVTYNNYELLLQGLTYGITDQLQITAMVLAPLLNDTPLLGTLAGKWRFAATPRLHVSFQASGTFLHSSKSGVPSQNLAFFGPGLFASACLNADCSSVASAGGQFQGEFLLANDESPRLVACGGSLFHALGPHIKLAGEILWVAARTDSTDPFDNPSGGMLNYGVRLHTARVAGEIGFITPFSGGDNPFRLGLPFISATYRWN